MHDNLAITGGLGFIGLNCLHYWIEHSLAHRFSVIDDFSIGRVEDLANMLERLGNLEIKSDGTLTRCILNRHQDSCSKKEQIQTPDGCPQEILIEVHRHNISQREGLESALENASAVLHLAGQTGVMPSIADPVRDMEVNVSGSLNLLEVCRRMKIPKFIFSSSSAPLGNCTSPLSEESVPHPISSYGASKLAVEGYCSAYYSSFGLKTIALRFSNVYGPWSRNKGSVIAAFIRNVLAGRPLVVFGTGNQTRDFLFVEDLCQAIAAAIETDNINIFGMPIHIATGIETSINTILEKIDYLARLWDVGPLIISHEPARAGEMEKCFVSIDKAKGSLGYTPVWNLDKGLEQTWNWYLEKQDKKCMY